MLSFRFAWEEVRYPLDSHWNSVYNFSEWRRPTFPTQTADYATYLEIVTWFLDTPSPEAPFSIHRLAAATREFGMDIGHWVGPSLAAGAIKYVMTCITRLIL